MANEMSAETAGASANRENSQFTAPQIALPKGGGAIRGIGEKFAANAVTGTGSLTIPIALSPGRSGFGPQLSLTYDSGSGNGPFGMGCVLSLPAIARKTDKGLPQYYDLEESDVFILSGAEDLVPVLAPDCDQRWRPDEFERDGYRVKRYRPRIEGLFARIERWTRLKDGDVHWRSISKANILTIYGKSLESRIADPAAPDRVFSWLICESYDDRGNGITYEYVSENDNGVDLCRANERHRIRTANRYLKRVRYGNRRPFRFRIGEPRENAPGPCKSEMEQADWMFEAILDYGDEHYQEASPDADGWIFVDASLTPKHGAVWPARCDAFSSFRSSFEVRTYRVCRRVMMYHHFPEELGVADYLVRATEFAYHPKAIGSFMTAVTQSGFKRQTDGRYLKRSLPPVELSYTSSPLEDPTYDKYEVKEVEGASLENLPGIDGGSYRWLDLDGEGISGVLSEQGTGWYYKPNLGNGRFGPIELIASKPAGTGLQSGRQEFLDVGGDGNLDLVQLGREPQGFFERTLDAHWGRFRNFAALPVQDWKDPNLRFVDLTGDGVADVLITEGDVFVWHPSLLIEGFGTRVRVPVAQDEEKGPQIVFSDGTQSIYLADMSGDGLSDIVRIRNGEICYWPNLGYGRFGAKVRMDNAPLFDEPDQFDQRRIRLADTDGSGTTDILYLGRDGIRIYLNQTGNSWSAARTLSRVPPMDSLISVSVVDFLGRGTACILWSSPLPAGAGRPLRYVDLMDGQKPHLLTGVKNNLGAETVVEYASSTEFYLADKKAGKPWVTRLPFPVHVVKRVETYDRISRNRFVTSYRYHHGYFDAIEREFRGFGMVEQLDTEQFATLSQSEHFPTGENVAESSHVPPVLTKTWFHLGAFLKDKGVTKQYADEYYREGDVSRGESALSEEQFAAMLLPDTILPESLEIEEIPEACRALKGSILRQEVYALDGTDAEDRPYSVSERNYSIQLLQSRDRGRHAVFFAHPREQIDFNYERRLFPVADGKIIDGSASSHCTAEWRTDPRVTHAMTMEVDAYGNVLLAAAIGYGRRFDDPDPVLTPPDRQKQKQTQVTFSANGYTNAILEKDSYRIPLPCESQTFELLNARAGGCLHGITNPFRLAELRSNIRQAGDGRHEIPYEDYIGNGVKGTAPYRRLIEHLRTLYRRDDCGGLLPLGQVQALALPGESFRLAFTPGLLSQFFKRNGDELLPDRVGVLGREGGYRLGDELAVSNLFPEGPRDHWWTPSGRVFFSPTSGEAITESEFAREHFFLPHRYQDPFGNSSLIAYDGHRLLLRQTRDALDNTVLAESDYRVLQPRRITDPNRNRSEVVFDALGLVAGSAIMGKINENKGDSLAGFKEDLEQSELAAFLENPMGQASKLLAGATTRVVYDLHRYNRSAAGLESQPVFAAALAREVHVSDLTPGGESRIQISISYSDGFSRQIQNKIQGEPGQVDVEQIDGNIVAVDTGQNIRWVASGWTVFNNKGKPVRQYEPFFSVDHKFQFGKAVGVSRTLFYDPRPRLVGTSHPNHTYEKVVFGPWQQATWDVNDTVAVIDPRQDPDLGPYLARLPEADLLPTWYGRRKDGGMGDWEKDAANKAAVHAGTPTTGYLDSLGRPFLSAVHNRSHTCDGSLHETYTTRTELDVVGNQRAITDTLGRLVLAYGYSLAGTRIWESSMEAGQRWTLNDVANKTIRAWDSRGHTFRTEYDALRRPVRVFVVGGDRDLPDREVLQQKTVYGEDQGDGGNHRGRVFQVFDTVGVVTSVECDFKGNLQTSTRQLVSDYKTPPDWASKPGLDLEVFTSKTTFDALNRPTALTTPDGSVTLPTYNISNLLERLTVKLRGAETQTPFVTNIEYDAKGQRLLIEYGILDAKGDSKVRTKYTYDPETFRLKRLLTMGSSETRLQDLNYTYDPVGNITSIRDDSQQTVYFKGQVVKPHNCYVYDSIYRLIVAEGREHIGQVGEPIPPNCDNCWMPGLPHPNDGQAMRRYREQYNYDPAGNFLRMIHVAANGNWTRSFEYHEPSLIESQKMSNRLSSSSVGAHTERYRHDAHGNMVRMPHLGPSMEPGGENVRWDFADRLSSIEHPGGGYTFYAYDASGQRTRKVIERPGLTRSEEWVYLGGYEVVRTYEPDGSTVKTAEETLHIMAEKKRVALVHKRTFGDSLLPQLVRFQFSNHLSSATLELDEQAHILSYEEYTAYGCSAFRAADTAFACCSKRYRFCGKERDRESGLYYYGSRYYAPWLARWLSTDPAGTVDGTNLFVYGRDNPVMNSDPTGAYCDPTTQCCIDPSTPTAREEALQQSLPESERYLPPETRPETSSGSGGAVPPETTSATPTGITNAVGAIQVGGGGVEMYAGGAGLITGIGLLLLPEPSVSKAAALIILGGILFGHGADTTAAGVRTLNSGQIQRTYTYQGAEALSQDLGASPGLARGLATTVDIAAGLGPSIGVGLTRQSLISAAEEGGPSLAVGYLHRGTSVVGETGQVIGVPVGAGQVAGVPLGHNVVGVIAGDGTQQFFHLVIGKGGQALMVPYAGATAESLAEGGYLMTMVPTTASGATNALVAASKTVPAAVAGQSWAILGPNCTTAAADVLTAGGASVPLWAQSSPLLLHAAMQFPMLGQSVASGTSAIVVGLSSNQQP